MTSLQLSLTCGCNTGKNYASNQTFRKHLQSKRHIEWEASNQKVNLQHELTRAQNRIVALEAEVLRLRFLLEHPNKRNVSALKKKEVAASQSWKCNECSMLLDSKFEVDHCLPLSQGGGNETSNLRALCKSCHKAKTSEDFSEC